MKSAREILDVTESAECRTILLEYIEDNSTGDPFDRLDLTE